MRTRVTVSLPEELLREAERGASYPSRSAIVEAALRLLVRSRTNEEIEASLDAYYGMATAEESAEEEAMVRAFQRSRSRADLDHEGDRRKKARRR